MGQAGAGAMARSAAAGAPTLHPLTPLPLRSSSCTAVFPRPRPQHVRGRLLVAGCSCLPAIAAVRLPCLAGCWLCPAPTPWYHRRRCCVVRPLDVIRAALPPLLHMAPAGVRLPPAAAGASGAQPQPLPHLRTGGGPPARGSRGLLTHSRRGCGHSHRVRSSGALLRHCAPALVPARCCSHPLLQHSRGGRRGG